MHTVTGAGRLLDKIAYVSRPASKDTDLVGDPITITDTFPYNPDSKTAPNTALQWARRVAPGSTKHEPEVVLLNNEPFDITIVDLDLRGRGGRAYKVVDNEMRRFDLREDQLIEIFRLVGVLPNGIVPGKFVWGLLGNQVHLVLVGGDLHKDMIEGAQAKKAFEAAADAGLHPTEATLQAGHIYQKKDKTLHLFLGRVRRASISKVFFAFLELPTKPYDWTSLDLDAFPRDYVYNRYREEAAVAKKWDSMSWAERCQWSWYDSKKIMQQQYPEAAPGYYYQPGDIALMSSPKFEADVGVEQELSERLKINEGAKHCYVNGHGDDLAEDEWLKNGGSPREWEPRRLWGDRRLTIEAERRAHYVKVKEEYINARRKFQTGLEWL